MSEKINTDHFSTMEELLEHLKNWERDDDIDAYYRFFSPGCAFELANKIKKQQKEIEDLKAITQNYNAIGGETFGDDRIIVCSMKYFDDGFFKKNYIFKDKIREIIEHYNNELEHIKNGEEFENEKPMYYWGKVALENLLEDN